MKYSREKQLEYESRLAFRNLLPKRWIVRDLEPDVGIDMEVEIVEGEDVTNKVLWLQIKATESKRRNGKTCSYAMKTKHLKHYEASKLPVIVIYGIKQSAGNFDFYFLFAQKYITEVLSEEKPDWRGQKTITVRFSSKLENVEDLVNVATEGYLYVAAQQLNIQPNGAHYWLDGIPQSDDKELKERTSKALTFMLNDRYCDAIKEFESILRVCTVSPTERMSVLLNLGNAYYSLSQNDNALKNYEAVLHLTGKVTEEDALEGKASALGNIGVIYSDKGDLDNALKYHQEGP